MGEVLGEGTIISEVVEDEVVMWVEGLGLVDGGGGGAFAGEAERLCGVKIRRRKRAWSDKRDDDDDDNMTIRLHRTKRSDRKVKN